MEKQPIAEQDMNMTEEQLRYFLKGLKIKIKQSGMTQAAFAEGVTSSVNLSNILRREVGTSEEMRENLARRAGVSVTDLILLGKDSEIAFTPPLIPIAPLAEADPDQIISAMIACTRKFREIDAEMRLWQVFFEALPVAALIIKDGLIEYQNTKSRVWGHIKGQPLHSSCLNVDCEKSGDCPVRRSVENGVATTGTQRIGAMEYKIFTAPLRVADHEYTVVIAIEDGQPYGPGGTRENPRRRKEDREQEAAGRRKEDMATL